MSPVLFLPLTTVQSLLVIKEQAVVKKKIRLQRKFGVDSGRLCIRIKKKMKGAKIL